MSQRAVPQVVKVADKTAFLKGHKLRAVKFWWSGNVFVMGVTDATPEKKEKEDDDRR